MGPQEVAFGGIDGPKRPRKGTPRHVPLGYLGGALEGPPTGPGDEPDSFLVAWLLTRKKRPRG